MDSFRKELKTKAKEILHIKIWPFFLMCLLTMLDAGILAKIFFTSPFKAAYSNFITKNSKNGEEIDKKVLWITFKENYVKLLKNTFMRDLFLILWSLPIIIGFAIFAACAAVLIISVLGDNLELLENLLPNINEYLGYITESFGYINNIVTQGMQKLLLIAAAGGYILMCVGIIVYISKIYAYYTTDFVIGENPDIDWKDAIKQSKQMMKNYKFFAFKLDLSFIGWYLAATLLSLAAGNFAFILMFIGKTVIEVYRSTTIAQFYIQKQDNIFVNQ